MFIILMIMSRFW